MKNNGKIEFHEYFHKYAKLLSRRLTESCWKYDACVTTLESVQKLYEIFDVNEDGLVGHDEVQTSCAEVSNKPFRAQFINNTEEGAKSGHRFPLAKDICYNVIAILASFDDIDTDGSGTIDDDGVSGSERDELRQYCSAKVTDVLFSTNAVDRSVGKIYEECGFPRLHQFVGNAVISGSMIMCPQCIAVKDMNLQLSVEVGKALNATLPLCDTHELNDKERRLWTISPPADKANARLLNRLWDCPQRFQDTARQQRVETQFGPGTRIEHDEYHTYKCLTPEPIQERGRVGPFPTGPTKMSKYQHTKVPPFRLLPLLNASDLRLEKKSRTQRPFQLRIPPPPP
jgi:hypothetical protein